MARLLDSRKARQPPTREGISALVVHTSHFSCQTTKGAGPSGFSGKPARSFNSRVLLGISGAGAAPATVTDAIDADRKSDRLPPVRVYYRGRCQMLMIGLSNPDNRRTGAAGPATKGSPRRASPLVLSGSSTSKFLSLLTRADSSSGASCFL